MVLRNKKKILLKCLSTSFSKVVKMVTVIEINEIIGFIRGVYVCLESSYIYIFVIRLIHVTHIFSREINA